MLRRHICSGVVGAGHQAPGVGSGYWGRPAAFVSLRPQQSAGLQLHLRHSRALPAPPRGLTRSDLFMRTAAQGGEGGSRNLNPALDFYTNRELTPSGHEEVGTGQKGLTVTSRGN